MHASHALQHRLCVVRSFRRPGAFGRAWLQPCRKNHGERTALAAEAGFTKRTSGAEALWLWRSKLAQLKLCPSKSTLRSSESTLRNLTERDADHLDCCGATRKIGPVSFAACLLLLPLIQSSAQIPAPRPLQYDCAYTSTPIRIDGRIDDAAWKAAAWTTDFVDIEGDSKPKPRFRTRAKMLWDNNYLYIAAEMEEPDVHGSLTQHDSVIFHDNDFEVFLKPLPDTLSYYEYEINALNTGWDLYLPKPYKMGGKADNSWDINGLKTAIAVQGSLNKPDDTDRGWTVEIAYPLSAFQSRQDVPRPVDGTVWRINFSRVEWKAGQPKEDNWVWSPQGVVNMHVPDQWGFLRFYGAGQ